MCDFIMGFDFCLLDVLVFEIDLVFVEWFGDDYVMDMGWIEIVFLC